MSNGGGGGVLRSFDITLEEETHAVASPVAAPAATPEAVPIARPPVPANASSVPPLPSTLHALLPSLPTCYLMGFTAVMFVACVLRLLLAPHLAKRRRSSARTN